MSPEGAIRAYCTAFEAGDAAAIVSLFAPGGLYEMPFLTPPRLVGRAEIAAGLARIFEVVASRRVTIIEVKAAGPAAIAEGSLEAEVPRDGETLTVPFAMVLECGAEAVSRLSVYCDARPHRLWTDGPVLALGEGSAAP